MDEEIQRRRDPILLDAIDPLNGKKIKVQLSYQRLQAIAGRSKGQVMETGYIVPEILQQPHECHPLFTIHGDSKS